MSRLHLVRSTVALIGLLSIPAAAGAQSPSNSPWGHGTTLSGFAGVAADADRAGSALGVALGWEVTPKVAIEGSGSWLDRGAGAESFAASLKVRASLFGRDKAAPFVTAGVGAYRASYERTSEAIPAFHRNRMATGTAPQTRATFTDPTFVFGGGVNLFVSRHIAVRPDVEATVVMRDSRRYVVTTAGIHLAFHFEDHPVTPARNR